MTDYNACRTHMVESQLKTNDLTDQGLIDVFAALPRELFLPEHKRPMAYVDEDVAVGGGHYLMEPMVQARLFQALNLSEDDLVLEVGAGCGCGTAILSHLTGTVVAIEPDEAVRLAAQKALESLEICNVVFEGGDITQGNITHAPYDGIVIEGAVRAVPQTLFDQLSEGGRLVAVIAQDVIGKDVGCGQAVLYTRYGDNISSRVLFDAAIPWIQGFEGKSGFTL